MAAVSVLLLLHRTGQEERYWGREEGAVPDLSQIPSVSRVLTTFVRLPGPGSSAAAVRSRMESDQGRGEAYSTPAEDRRYPAGMLQKAFQAEKNPGAERLEILKF